MTSYRQFLKNLFTSKIRQTLIIYNSICLSVPQNTLFGKFMYYFTEHGSISNRDFYCFSFTNMWFSWKQSSVREHSFFLQKVKWTYSWRATVYTTLEKFRKLSHSLVCHRQFKGSMFKLQSRLRPARISLWKTCIVHLFAHRKKLPQINKISNYNFINGMTILLCTKAL